jgi:hypothetical protein
MRADPIATLLLGWLCMLLGLVIGLGFYCVFYFLRWLVFPEKEQEVNLPDPSVLRPFDSHKPESTALLGTGGDQLRRAQRELHEAEAGGTWGDPPHLE